MRVPKSTPLYVFVALMLCAAALAFAQPLSAQTEDKEKARLTRALQRAMAREAPLAEEDCRLYLANLENIFALRQAPERANDVAAGIGAWPQSRFVYVTTKMAVGMSMLLKPEDPRNQAVPDFAKPTEAEMRIIRNHRDELVKSVEALQASRDQ